MECSVVDECCSGRCIAKDDATSRCARKSLNRKKRSCGKDEQIPPSGPWIFSTQFGNDGAGDTNFRGPTGVAISSRPLEALVADSNNYRISSLEVRLDHPHVTTG